MMNSCRESEDQYILLNSSIHYLDTAAYISLFFLNAEELTLKSTDLMSVSDTLIYYLKNKQNISIKISASSEKAIIKLQHLFDDALDYERTCIKF